MARLWALALALMAGTATAFTAPSARRMPPARRIARMATPLADNVWSMAPLVRVQGDTLKTWDLADERTERVQLSIKSEGRPIEGKIELWQTPSYTPTEFRVYTEDGLLRPVNAIIETPLSPKTVAVFNKANVDFPFDATVVQTGLGKAYDSLSDVESERVQGGMIKSYSFGPEVKSVQVLMKTDERNMKAKVELTQGPNQVRQYIELYASKGYKNPFYTVIQTPGAYNTIRVINQNTVEFPFDAWVLPYETADAGEDADGPVMSGGGWGR